MHDRHVSFRRAEHYLLGFLPLIFGLIIIPSQNPVAEFTYARLFVLGCAVFILTALRLAQAPGVMWSMLPNLLKAQPSYIHASLAFCISLCVSASLSSDWAQAWLGATNSPVGALFALLCLAIFWLYSSGAAPSRKPTIALLVATSIISIAEFTGFRPISFIVERYFHIGSGFPIATVGYRGHLAGVLVILALMPLHWYSGVKKDWRFWSLLVLASVALGCTTNTAAVVAMVVSIAAYLVLELIRSERGLHLVTVPVVIALSMSAVFPLQAINKYLVARGNIDIVSDAKEITSTNTFSIRLLLWKSAINMTKAKPIIGWGAQTYNRHWFDFLSKEQADKTLALELNLPKDQRFSRVQDLIYYVDGSGRRIARTQRYESPHNATLDVLYSQGVVGIATLMWFFTACLRAAYRYAGIGGLIALLPFAGVIIYLQAWFATVPVMGLVVMLLGATMAELRKMHSSSSVDSELPPQEEWEGKAFTT